eukprot:1159110-Pelagomonas_calceolata.AAC.2
MLTKDVRSLRVEGEDVRSVRAEDEGVRGHASLRCKICFNSNMFPEGQDAGRIEPGAAPFMPVGGEHLLRVKMGPGGMEALVALGGGDMRRSLNILQTSRSCSKAGA